ncbi:MAG: WD40 repeat domain-containing protein [Cyanobacteria bacterium FC1]|nr:WD40 repeat domain-containing protein [Cyanobacteria bacterium FC1]
MLALVQWVARVKAQFALYSVVCVCCVAFGGNLCNAEVRRVESPASPTVIARTLSGHTQVAISPNGRFLAGTTSETTITVWDLTTGQALRTLDGHTLPILALAIAPDNQTLLSTGHDRTLHLWNLQTGELKQTLSGHSDWVEALAISPTGDYMASGGGDRQIRIWSLHALSASLQKVFSGHSTFIASLAISPNGEYLASGSWDEIRIWQVSTGQLIVPMSSEVQAIALYKFGMSEPESCSEPLQLIKLPFVPSP